MEQRSETAVLTEFGYTRDQTGLEIAQAWIDAGLVTYSNISSAESKYHISFFLCNFLSMKEYHIDSKTV